MTKGEKLKTLLDQANELGAKMDNLFLKHGMKTPELAKLPETDREEWLRLKEAKNDILNQVSPFFPEKKKGMSM